MPRPLRVFLCHARENKSIVRELYRQLTAEGWMDVWLDEQKLLPGQEWSIEIEKAVEQADVVIVCLSNKSVDREGYVQKELRFVLNIADEKPEGTIFIVPLRLDDCVVPRRIRAWQYVDYFPKSNQTWAYQRLLESLKLRAAKLGVSIEKPVSITIEDEQAKADRERIAAQKAEKERLAHEKAERERKAKEERDRIARQKAEEQRIARIEALRKINFKPILAIGGVIIALPCLVFGVNYLIKNFPVAPVATKIPTATEARVVITPIATFISEKDSMTMVYVPEGEFTMGSYSGADDEKPVHRAYLVDFWIDQTEVTNAMYAKCVADGVCKAPSIKSSYTRSSYYSNSEFENYPVTYVDWSMAKTYCEWRSDRLPTEAEWEKAARGTDSRTYPWGEGKSCNKANYSDDNKYCIGDTTKVGSYPDGVSPYGLYDMAGNVWEWVNDWHDGDYYKNSPLFNPLGPDTVGYRILRGGSWDISGSDVRSANRFAYDPSYTNYNIGFRCARSP